MIGPFRIAVFGTHEVTKGKGKRAKIEKQGYGFILWNPDEDVAAKAGRPGYGSFEFYGLAATRRVALDALMQSGIEQVSIRTNQDKQIARLYKSNWAEYVGQANLFAPSAAISKAFKSITEERP